MSVRHHEQLFAHQQREMQLMQSLQECAGILDQAVSLLNERNPGMVPPFMIEALMRFSSAANAVEAPQPLPVQPPMSVPPIVASAAAMAAAAAAQAQAQLAEAPRGNVVSARPSGVTSSTTNSSRVSDDSAL
jgi:hypothetical protein